MKNLQEHGEESWRVPSTALMGGVKRPVAEPRQVILLLHGLAERGRRIFRKLLPYLPEDALILSPNGVFPLPRQTDDGMRVGYTWYLFDRVKKSYVIDQTQARIWLRDLVTMNNPRHLPVTIIGFSQGGYLAPLVGQDIPETTTVIGLSCEFRSNLVHAPVDFSLHSVHGELDEIISVQTAQNEVQLLREKNIRSQWHAVEDAGHEITPSVGTVVARILEQHGKRSL